MRYFVIADDGNRYGPADIPTLNEWIQQGRLLPTTLLEEEGSGARISANSVMGLNFGGAAPVGPPSGVQPGPSGPFSPGPAAAPYAGPYGQSVTGNIGNTENILAWVCGAVGICCCCCFPLPIAGLLFAQRAKTKGNPTAQAALIFNVVALVITLAYWIIQGPMAYTKMQEGFRQGFNQGWQRGMQNQNGPTLPGPPSGGDTSNM
jgi:hypothetical protein